MAKSYTRKTAKTKIATLEKEIEELKIIANQPANLFEIIENYTDVCEELGIEELTEKDFNSKKEFRYHQIKNIEELFNCDWKVNINNINQQKFYPYYNIRNGRLVFDVSFCNYGYSFDGQIALYKDKATSDFIGKKFIYIYENLI